MSEVFGVDHKLVVLPVLAASLGVSAYALYRLQQSQNKVPGSDVYESTKLLSEYLVFHFGTPEQLIPYPFGPKDALDFPKRCAELCLKHFPKTEGHTRALDIGCAVGRSTFELARVIPEVIGIDYSQSFIDAANVLRRDGQMPYSLTQEGDIFSSEVAYVPKDIDRQRTSFEQGDACALRGSLGGFDVVLAANLVCRLHRPRDFLKRLTELLPKPGSILVITAPYTWLRDFTDRKMWLAGYVDPRGEKVTGFSALQKELGPCFDLVEQVDMPFFIRETCRKNQWTVAHATVWRRK